MIKPNFLSLVRLNEKYGLISRNPELKKGEHMNEELLTRLVDALEGINSNLGEMRVTLEILQRYVDGFTTVGEKGMRIGISGDVNTY